MTTAIFITKFVPMDVGNGGHHRSYQILHDLELAVGRDNVKVISFERWLKKHPPPPQNLNVWAYIGREMKRRVAYYRENPARVLANTIYTPKEFSIPEFMAYYQQVIENIPKPAVCIAQHTGFSELIYLNSQYDIPTISCIDNLEAFDRGNLENRYPQSILSRRHMLARVIDFANEFQVLAQCIERLFISKVEAGLIGGLGLSAQHYPYIPVGLIRRRLEYVRRNRTKARIQPGLFLLVGSCEHCTTKESFLWFLQKARTNGLPNGVRVIVAGSQTDRLLPRGVEVPGLELKGWLQQRQLDQLMISTQAVLLPQLVGFGALTRFSELSCAGIPCIVLRHPTHAVDLPPGFEVVTDEWASWYYAMERLMRSDQRINSGYSTWENNQPRTLRTVVEKLIRNIT
ncbi:MAG: hypothetical protein ACFFCW_02455 [Candidatus Hodarchaeota archaeon]